jgi:two-component system phosphate regulon sensor histidine kinase PhoR
VDAVGDCIKQDNDASFDFKFKGKMYFAMVQRLPDTKLIMVVLTDITESRESAKQREEFFTNASHELKTPLTAIKGFNELTVINNKDEGIGKFIDGITRETNRMVTLIEDMLKLSEIENLPNVEFSEAVISEAVTEVREALSAAIYEKSISFEYSGDAAVKAKPEHLYELIKNLIENAVRYNNNGGRVTITVEELPKTIKLNISDNGIGISPEDHHRIFERFYRVEKSRSEKGGGTGLGLSIVKHICALYDWKISLKSKLGLGTDVTVTFGK